MTKEKVCQNKNKKDRPVKKQVSQSKVTLHCESVVFSGRSFVKRENLDRKLDRKGSEQ
ncbi:hypothetical protein [Limosilactobacillus reuteri]|uniref:hypothetical protein n=1 Tax=Limosilactobacillus reuteri TaxID=1598 RepID=UPI0015E873D7|nr:hypothetical protein [Limosilactobacillus reuteri]